MTCVYFRYATREKENDVLYLIIYQECILEYVKQFNVCSIIKLVHSHVTDFICASSENRYMNNLIDQGSNKCILEYL
jgi:hypothetical protein